MYDRHHRGAAMSKILDVIIIDEMNHILNRYSNGELSNKEALKQLMEKFDELQKQEPHP